MLRDLAPKKVILGVLDLADAAESAQQVADRLQRAPVTRRVVQYYFGTKEELLLAAMHHLAVQFGERAMERIRKVKETQDPVSPREVVAAILTQSLPVDDERRTFTVLNAAYFALSLTDPALAVGPLVKNSNVVMDVVASQLRSAQAAGDAPADLDPDVEAISQGLLRRLPCGCLCGVRQKADHCGR